MNLSPFACIKIRAIVPNFLLNHFGSMKMDKYINQFWHVSQTYNKATWPTPPMENKLPLSCPSEFGAK